MSNISIGTIVAAGLIVLILFNFRKKLSDLLKDDSTLPNDQRPYSLAKTILAFWTFIIFFSLCYIAIACGFIPAPTPGVLILMGIVVATTTAGTTIDTIQIQDPNIKRSQDVDPKIGFLTDILSDECGLSIHRFQAVLFNVVYGCAFIAIVVSEYRLIDFPKETLALLGISSGTYAILKVSENKTVPDSKKGPSGGPADATGPTGPTGGVPTGSTGPTGGGPTGAGSSGDA